MTREPHREAQFQVPTETDWIDERDTVTRAFDKAVEESRRREATFMKMGTEKAAEAEAAERGRLILKHERWTLDHEARKPQDSE